jgi:hypothetical protein
MAKPHVDESPPLSVGTVSRTKMTVWLEDNLSKDENALIFRKDVESVSSTPIMNDPGGVLPKVTRRRRWTLPAWCATNFLRVVPK